MQLRATGKVHDYYPCAVLSSCYIRSFLKFARSKLGVCREDQIAFLTSICSDDLNSIGWPKTAMIGPFVQGGLDGYPFGGRTGFGAFSHHIPEGGAALMFFGPHVGVTTSGEVGKIHRPGQGKATTCCGAAALALEALESKEGIAPLEPHCFPADDYQQETIRQIVRRNGDAIKAAGRPGGPERFVKMSEFIYQETKEAFFKMLKETDFKLPTFVFGGILVNQDGGKESLIEYRDLARIDHGKIQDLTEDFAEVSESQFRALEAGDTEALL